MIGGGGLERVDRDAPLRTEIGERDFLPVGRGFAVLHDRCGGFIGAKCDRGGVGGDVSGRGPLREARRLNVRNHAEAAILEIGPRCAFVELKTDESERRLRTDRGVVCHPGCDPDQRALPGQGIGPAHRDSNLA